MWISELHTMGIGYTIGIRFRWSTSLISMACDHHDSHGLIPVVCFSWILWFEANHGNPATNPMVIDGTWEGCTQREFRDIPMVHKRSQTMGIVFLIKVVFVNPTHESLESPWGFECSCVAVGSCINVGNAMRAPKVPILSTEFHFGISEHLWHMHAHPHVVKFMEILMEIVAILNWFSKIN